MHQLISQLGEYWWSWFIGAFTLLLLWGVSRALEWVWFRPMHLDRELRKQGLSGTVYRPIVGDMKENSRLNKEARAKPMPLSHDIGPRVLPLVHDTLTEFGNLSFHWIGPNPRIIIKDPELVREILSNKSGDVEKMRFSRLSGLLMKGVLVYEGEKWAKHRKILNPAFHVDKLKSMQHLFSICCDELVDRWDNSVGPDGSFELDVWEEMQNFTGDVISRGAFGSSYQEGRRIFQLQSEQVECIMKALATAYNPFHWFLQTENDKKMKQKEKEVRTLITGIIAKREKAIQNGKRTKDDLLGLLLESNMNEKGQNGKTNLRLGLTIDEVIEECKVFYFTGQKTPSVLLTWTLVVLSMHPEWQEKARDEVLQHFGSEKPDFDGLGRLKIVSMILYEMLRLYPPFVLLSRRTHKTMQLGDLTIPPGVLLALPTLFIHREPEIWGPDAMEFNPTRFAEGISKATKNGQVAFFPFAYGPRTCIGQNFALLEAKMVLCRILQHFTFELSERYQHAPYSNITVQPEHGAPIKFHKI